MATRNRVKIVNTMATLPSGAGDIEALTSLPLFPEITPFHTAWSSFFGFHSFGCSYLVGLRSTNLLYLLGLVSLCLTSPTSATFGSMSLSISETKDYSTKMILDENFCLSTVMATLNSFVFSDSE